MKKTFKIIGTSMMVAGVVALMSAAPVMACGGSSSASADGSSCGSKASVQTASADGAGSAEATKSSCGTKGSKADATTASASGTCSKSAANASFADAKDESYSKADCVAWLMTNKDYSEEEALAAYGTCSKTKTAAIQGVQMADASSSKDACVEWLMANEGYTKLQAEDAYDHCAKTKATAQKAVMLATSDKETIEKN